MSTTDTTIWDYVVTYGGPSLFMTAVFVFVMPLVWFKLARPRFRRWPSRLAVMLGAWLIAWFIAYGDVLMIAREAKRVCEAEAGLKVYRTAKADGFLGVYNIEPWKKRGFSFTEYKRSDGLYVRQEILDKKIKKTTADLPMSNYEYAYKTESLSRNLSRDVQLVRDMSTNKPLGELVHIRIYPGWLDSFFLSLTGARFSPAYCPDKQGRYSAEESYVQIIDATLTPK